MLGREVLIKKDKDVYIKVHDESFVKYDKVQDSKMMSILVEQNFITYARTS
jgi:hypothetical protein